MVTGVCELTYRLLPGMIERGWGRIINVASLAGLVPAPAGHTLYAATKAFLIKFSESLRAEPAATASTSPRVCPGFTLSEFHDVTGTRDKVNQMPAAMWMEAPTVARQGYDAVMARHADVHQRARQPHHRVAGPSYAPDAGPPCRRRIREAVQEDGLAGVRGQRSGGRDEGSGSGIRDPSNLRTSPNRLRLRRGRRQCCRTSDTRCAGCGAAQGSPSVAVLSLGLGVGVNTAMFSLVDSLLFRPLPVSAPATLVDVFTTSGDGDEYATTSYPDFTDLTAQNDVFIDMIGYSPMMAPLAWAIGRGWSSGRS